MGLALLISICRLCFTTVETKVFLITQEPWEI